MFCENCGRDNGDDYTVCPGCGKPKPGLFGEKQNFYSIADNDIAPETKLHTIDMSKQLSRNDEELKKYNAADYAAANTKDIKSPVPSSKLPSKADDFPSVSSASDTKLPSKTDDFPSVSSASDTKLPSKTDDFPSVSSASGTKLPSKADDFPSVSSASGTKLPSKMDDFPSVSSESSTKLPPELEEMYPEQEKKLPPQLNEMAPAPPPRTDTYYQPPQGYEYVPQQPVVDDNSGILWGILGFIIPIAGVIIFIVNKNTKPKSSRAALIGAVISVFGSCCCLPFLAGLTGYSG